LRNCSEERSPATLYLLPEEIKQLSCLPLLQIR